jgi:hypothetical protein
MLTEPPVAPDAAALAAALDAAVLGDATTDGAALDAAALADGAALDAAALADGAALDAAAVGAVVGAAVGAADGAAVGAVVGAGVAGVDEHAPSTIATMARNDGSLLRMPTLLRLAAAGFLRAGPPFV